MNEGPSDFPSFVKPERSIQRTIIPYRTIPTSGWFYFPVNMTLSFTNVGNLIQTVVILFKLSGDF